MVTPFAMTFVALCFQAERLDGVLVLTAGTYGNVIRFLPPLCMTREMLEEALQVLDDAFKIVTAVKK